MILSQGAASLTVGYLNGATAFLGSIIAGNGVNFGVVLLGRFVDEARRGDVDIQRAMQAAMTLTIGPTMVASLGASIAYGSLAATSFRGFADFAVIGAVGMLICWIATYMLLPALVVRFATLPKQTPKEPALARFLARGTSLLSLRATIAVVAGLALGGGLLAWRYIANDPFEYRLQKMRGIGEDTLRARALMQELEAALGRNFAGQSFIVADSIDQVLPIVTGLEQIDAGKPDAERLLGPVTSLYSVLPRDQVAKLALIEEIRTIISPAVLAELPDSERASLEALRPAADLAALEPRDLPASIQASLRERDGRVGLVLAVQPYREIGDWDGHTLLAYANAIRSVKLPDGSPVAASGAAVILADILDTLRRDAPRVALLATALVMVMLLGVVGFNRRAVAVLVSTMLGSLLLIAICALAGFRITFLDFVVLPMTLGLGIDYGINLATQRDDGAPDDTLISTAGAAVFVCSLTTIIGYGSLLVSDNQSIRGFGVLSLLGELCCLLVSLLVVPAVIRTYARRPSTQR
ncbi:MAG: MMPL family transporter [Myxococcales bacterium]|nr:MMPL family transporter [Myxococcales bacterium]